MDSADPLDLAPVACPDGYPNDHARAPRSQHGINREVLCPLF